MKKLQKIKLKELAGIDLNEKGLCRILGGGTPGECGCACKYADYGGSQQDDNYSANEARGLHSITCQPSIFPPGCIEIQVNCISCPVY